MWQIIICKSSLAKITGKHVIKMFANVNRLFVDYFQAIFQQYSSCPIIDKQELRT